MDRDERGRHTLNPLWIAYNCIKVCSFDNRSIEGFGFLSSAIEKFGMNSRALAQFSCTSLPLTKIMHF